MRSVLAPEGVTPTTREQTALSAPAPPATRRAWPTHILVATHGGKSADQALAAAQALAERSGARMTLIAAFTPRVPVPESARARRTSLRACEGPDRPRAARLLRAVHEQQRRLLGHAEMWPVRFGIGDPVRVILDAVGESDADLVVAGIGRPSPAERAGGDQVPIVVAHHLDVPLYAVVEDANVAPTRVVLVFPDGEVDVDTVRAAVACAAPGVAFCVVVPRKASPEGADDDPASVRDAVRDAVRGAVLAAARDASPAGAAPTVDVVETADDLLVGAAALARRVDAGLVALPMAGSPGVVRELIPNLAWPLLLTTKRSVLVAPGTPPLTASGEGPCAER